MLLFQADRDHLQLGKLIWAREGSLEFSFALIPLDHSAEVPSFSILWMFPQLQLIACCPQTGTFKSKVAEAGIHPEEKGQITPAFCSTTPNSSDISYSKGSYWWQEVEVPFLIKYF